ncbi:MAG: phosphatase PAP2 family protein [Finegoldia sp.]|nr:phosphatase PAP2 family protein [Finegoldia sp.]
MAFEFTILDLIQKLRFPFLDKFMVLVSLLSNGGLIWITLSVFLLSKKDKKKAGFTLALTLVLDLVITNLILKNLTSSLRPFQYRKDFELLIKRPLDYSFPSGHAAVSFAGASSLYISGEEKSSKPFFILSLLTCFSRLYLYVHFPSDVVSGMIVGFLIANLSNYLAEKFIYKSKKS